jgi:hypothetical protein
MKRVLLTIPAFLLVIGMFLTILMGLVRITLMIGEISFGIARVAAWCGELALGVVLLLSAVWIATHMAVWIFGPAAGFERAGISS